MPIDVVIYSPKRKENCFWRDLKVKTLSSVNPYPLKRKRRLGKTFMITNRKTRVPVTDFIAVGLLIWSVVALFLLICICVLLKPILHT